MKLSPDALALDLPEGFELDDPAGDEEPTRRGRREGHAIPRLGFHLLSLAVGSMLGVGAGTLTRAALSLSPLAGQTSPTTLGAVGGLVGLAICLAYGHLMAEARQGSITVRIDDERRSFPLRRRREVVRRATAYLLGGLGGLGILGGCGVFLYGRSAGVPDPLRLVPAPAAVALGVAAGAALATLALGEGIFRLTQRQDRIDHAPSLLLPAMLGYGAALGGLL